MFGFWDPFILFGGLSFWIISFFIAVAFIWCIEFDKSDGAVLLIVLSYAFLWGAVGINPIVYAWNNPITAFTYIGGYFLGGTVWTIVKWYFYLLRRRDEARKIRVYFDANCDDLNQKWKNNDEFNFTNWMNDGGSTGSGASRCRRAYNDRNYPPMATQHKGDILFWATYWPFSAFWTLLNDPIRRLWNAIYSVLGGILQRISNKVFADV